MFNTTIETVMNDDEAIDFVVLIPPELLVKMGWEISTPIKCYIEEIKVNDKKRKRFIVEER